MTLPDAVIRFLNEMGYSRLPGSTPTDLRFNIRISSGSDFRSQLIIYDEGLAVFWVYLTDQEYVISRRADVFELATRTNEKIVIGSIVTRLDDGAVIFRNTFDSRDIRPRIEALTRFFCAAAFPVQLWESAYQKLLAGKGTPADCLNAALIKADANDAQIVSKGTRKALISVEYGGLAAQRDQSGGVERNLEIVMTELRLV